MSNDPDAPAPPPDPADVKAKNLSTKTILSIQWLQDLWALEPETLRQERRAAVRIMFGQRRTDAFYENHAIRLYGYGWKPSDAVNHCLGRGWKVPTPVTDGKPETEISEAYVALLSDVRCHMLGTYGPDVDLPHLDQALEAHISHLASRGGWTQDEITLLTGIEEDA